MGARKRSPEIVKRFREYKAQWKREHRLQENEKQRDRRNADPEKHRARCRASNYDPHVRRSKTLSMRKYRAKMRQSRSEGKPEGLKFFLRHTVSSLITSRLRRRRGTGRSASMFTFLPYTMAELMVHLESLFQPGMSWTNYGEWHIDHKRPDASFTYSSVIDPEFQECWALSNLQPLWASENLRKHDMMPEEWERYRTTLVELLESPNQVR